MHTPAKAPKKPCAPGPTDGSRRLIMYLPSTAPVEVCLCPACALASSLVPLVVCAQRAAAKLNIPCRYFIRNQVLLFSRVSFLSPAYILGNGINVFLPCTSQAIFIFCFPEAIQLHTDSINSNISLPFGQCCMVGTNCQPACASLFALPALRDVQQVTYAEIPFSQLLNGKNNHASAAVRNK